MGHLLKCVFSCVPTEGRRHHREDLYFQISEMPDPDSDLIKNVVSERLKYVDGLVRNRKIDEAVKEINEIRKLDASNPYALAYEERIRTLQQNLKAEPPPPSPTTQQAKESPSPFRSGAHPTPPPLQSTPVERGHQETFSATPEPPSLKPVTSSAGAKASPSQKSPGKGSIVLIDDDALLVQALSEFLEDNRFNTRTFTRAEDALGFLKENSPDLIVCDVNLETSTYGGFTLHEKLRKFEHLRDVPFIFLSGLNDTAIVLAGKELGADDYLTKPIEPEALLAVVKGKLKRYRQMKKNA